MGGKEVVLEADDNDQSVIRIYQQKMRGQGIKKPMTVHAYNLITALQENEVKTWFTNTRSE